MSSAAAPIAVVGQGCALPGALSPQALWERVARGDDLITEVRQGRWGVPPHLITTTSGQPQAERA